VGLGGGFGETILAFQVPGGFSVLFGIFWKKKVPKNHPALGTQG